jgi:hypothetical protein
VIAGPSGTGKSHLVQALAHAAIEKDLRVAWFTLDTLTAAIGRAKADGSIARTVTRICRGDLIVVDDIGMLPAGQDAAEAFYRITDAAYERRSVAVTSNIHPSGFDSIMPKTLATATVDRLLHHAHLVPTKGDSHRLAEAPRWQGGDPAGHLTPPTGRTRGHQPGKLVAASPEKTRPHNRISRWPLTAGTLGAGNGDEAHADMPHQPADPLTSTRAEVTTAQAQSSTGQIPATS